jgi:hypothetical protein
MLKTGKGRMLSGLTRCSARKGSPVSRNASAFDQVNGLALFLRLHDHARPRAGLA